MEIIRNLFRRKFRTVLTLFGIVIGIFALIVMGSMSEKMNSMMDGGVEYVTGQISISPKGSNVFSGSGGIVEYKNLEKVRNVKGVKNASGDVSFLLSEETGHVQFGIPEMVNGVDLSTAFKNRNFSNIEMKKGRLLKESDRGVCIIGIDISKSKDVDVGEYLKIRKKKFKVVGVMEKTLTGPDKMVIMNIRDAQPLYVDSNPLLKTLKKESKKAKEIDDKTLQFMDEKTREKIKEARSFKQSEVITSISAEWEDGADPEKVSKRIGDEVSGVQTLSPAEGKKSFEQASLIINAVVLGSTIIALIVGGIAVLNTMFMAVNERVCEIGLKQAIGAKTKHIMKDILFEAVIISIVGAMAGIIFGFLVVTVINAYTANTGIEIFQVTPRLIWISFGFAIVLGLMGGFYPALRASRFEPAKALREEH